MDRGYIRMWRKSMDSEAFQDDGLWRLWSMILMEASWKPRSVKTPAGRGFSIVDLGPGQLVFGSRRWAEILGKPKSTVHRMLKRLQRSGNVQLQPGRHYTIVTICNWDIYQPAEGGRGTEDGTESGRNRDYAKKLKNEYHSGRLGAGREDPAPSPQPARMDMGWMKLHCYIPADEADAFKIIVEQQPRDLVKKAVLICRSERREKGLNLRVCLSDLMEVLDGLIRHQRKDEQDGNG